MNLAQSQKKQFRSIGHDLHPLVTVAAKGLSETVMTEINRALFDHELIKVKFSVGDREVKNNLIADMCKQTGATLVQAVGNVALVYLNNPNADPKKSNIEG
jgi:RNA-binding protein